MPSRSFLYQPQPTTLRANETTPQVDRLRSNAEQNAALQQWGNVDSDDPKAIRRLQFKLQVAMWVQNWLANLAVDARKAEETLSVVE